MRESNSGVPYERLIQQLYAKILALDGLTDVNVQHDVKLEGTTRDEAGNAVKHQIDVYWEFTLGDVRYRTVIQAKDWSTAVALGDVMLFHKVLDELPGQPRGIMITRTGFQSGAETYAKAHGIALYVLRTPTETDLGSRIRKIGVNLTMRAVTVGILGFVSDDDWVKERVGAEVVNDRIKLELGMPEDTWLFDEHGQKQQTLYDFAHAALRQSPDADGDELTVPFAVATYFKTVDERAPFVKINAVILRFDAVETQHQMFHDYSSMFTYMLKEVTGDTGFFVDAQMNVRRIPKAR